MCQKRSPEAHRYAGHNLSPAPFPVAKFGNIHRRLYLHSWYLSVPGEMANGLIDLMLTQLPPMGVPELQITCQEQHYCDLL
jgi:hypothetical protein